MDVFASARRGELRGPRMPLVNCCVVLGKHNRFLYPWNISGSHVSTTICGYYHNTFTSLLDCTTSGNSVAGKTFRLSKGYLDKSKETSDLIDLELDQC